MMVKYNKVLQSSSQSLFFFGALGPPAVTEKAENWVLSLPLPGIRWVYGEINGIIENSEISCVFKLCWVSSIYDGKHIQNTVYATVIKIGLLLTGHKVYNQV